MRLGVFSLMKMPPFPEENTFGESPTDTGSIHQKCRERTIGEHESGYLPDENRTAIHVENFPGDESGVRRAQKQDWSRYLFRSADPAEGNGGMDLLKPLR